MEIEVHPDGWGDAQLQDIKALLLDASSHLNGLLKHPVTGTIQVKDANPSCEHEGCGCEPITLLRQPLGHGPYTVRLVVRDNRWAQFAYQFSHEFCHIMSAYERLWGNPNSWFHEALCELASIFTLRRMAETWPSDPPYPNWADYAYSLAQYANDRLSDKNHQLPAGIELRDWLPRHEQELRENPYMRDKNAIVAYRLLPLFEEEPSGWNAVRQLPESAGILADYLSDWRGKVEPDQEQFVQRVEGTFQ